MYAWICSLCRRCDRVSAWRCSRTCQHRECFTESASAFAVRAVKAWCALVSLCSLRLNASQVLACVEASVMSPALAHFTVRVRLQPPLLVSHMCAVIRRSYLWDTSSFVKPKQPSVSAVVSAAAFWARCGEAVFSSPSQSICTTVLLCPSLCVGRHEKLCVLGYVRLRLTARIRSTAQPQCSLLRFDWNKFSIHNKVIKRSNLKSKSYFSKVYTLCPFRENGWIMANNVFCCLCEGCICSLSANQVRSYLEQKSEWKVRCVCTGQEKHHLSYLRWGDDAKILMQLLLY